MLARARRRADRAPRPVRGRHPPPARPRRDRRAERRDRRLGPASRRRARRLPRGDRDAEDVDPALEERGLRGRRRMDRARVMSAQASDDSGGGIARAAHRRRRPWPAGSRSSSSSSSRSRVLRLVRELAVRARLRPADPRARARPLRRGEAAGAARHAADVHPVLRRVRHDARTRARFAVAERARLAGRPVRRRSRRRRGLGGRHRLGTRAAGSSCSRTSASCSTRSTCFRSASSTEAPSGARDGHVAAAADPVRERRPGRGAAAGPASTPS